MLPNSSKQNAQAVETIVSSHSPHQTSRRSDFHTLDFQTQAGMSLLPVLSGGVDIRKTHFTKAVPPLMLQMVASSIGLGAEAQCSHGGDRAVRQMQGDLAKATSSPGTKDGFCAACHQLYCNSLECGSDSDTSDAEDVKEMTRSPRSGPHPESADKHQVSLHPMSKAGK